MTPNVGSVDRTIRIVVGLAILSLVFFLEGNARWWGLVGIGFILTGVFRVCPPYKWLGINTLGKGEGGAPR